MAPEQLLLLGGILLAGMLLVVGGAWIGLRARRQGAGDVNPLKPASDDRLRPASAEALGPLRRESPAWLSELQRKLPPDAVLISRDSATGEWVVELEGQRYRRLNEVHDDKAAAKIVSAIEGIKVFAGIAPATGPESSSTPPAARPPLSPSTTLRVNSVEGLAGAAHVLRRSASATYPAPEGSIIAQIETILQKEIALHPELSQRSIHMGATPDGSLLIEVDRQFYKSPDDVPELPVRDLVMQAVRAWETSSQ